MNGTGDKQEIVHLNYQEEEEKDSIVTTGGSRLWEWILLLIYQRTWTFELQSRKQSRDNRKNVNKNPAERPIHMPQCITSHFGHIDLLEAVRSIAGSKKK